MSGLRLAKSSSSDLVVIREYVSLDKPYRRTHLAAHVLVRNRDIHPPHIGIGLLDQGILPVHLVGFVQQTLFLRVVLYLYACMYDSNLLVAMKTSVTSY